MTHLRTQVTCPHCWHLFVPDQILWVSESTDLLGDSRLGGMAQQRFLPNRFDINTNAIDSQGFSCSKLACPDCHLMIPRELLEVAPFFLSIVGAPAVGKSYYLASMSWQLRKTMPRYFQYNISDTSPEMNHRLQEYESQQFFETGNDRLVAIEKTEVYGANNNTVLINGEEISYPQPFLFTLTPGHNHPLIDRKEQLQRILCLYDNAGESYLPGEDKALLPLTHHLSRSHAIMFLFDPTQDPRFRKACRGKTNDPQMLEGNNSVPGASNFRRSQIRQELILSEMILRVRTHLGLSTNSVKQPPPLIIVLTKADAWSHLLGDVKFVPPWRKIQGENYCALDMTTIEHVSECTHKLLADLVPEIAATAKQLTKNVIFIPVSATGIAPTLDTKTGMLGFRPDDIKPFWVEAPILYALAQQTQGMIPMLKKRNV